VETPPSKDTKMSLNVKVQGQMSPSPNTSRVHRGTYLYKVTSISDK